MFLWVIVCQFFTHSLVASTNDVTKQAIAFFRHDGTLSFVQQQTNKVLATIAIEIAETPLAMIQGLMYRKTLAADRGMLFLYDDVDERSFFMKNTRIALDIIFADADKKIVKIHARTKPYSLESLPSGQEAQFVVEVNAGFCEKHGVVTGDSITFSRLNFQAGQQKPA